MSMMAATVSSWGRSKVGPNTTPRLATVIRFSWWLFATLWRRDTHEPWTGGWGTVLDTLQYRMPHSKATKTNTMFKGYSWYHQTSCNSSANLEWIHFSYRSPSKHDVVFLHFLHCICYWDILWFCWAHMVFWSKTGKLYCGVHRLSRSKDRKLLAGRAEPQTADIPQLLLIGAITVRSQLQLSCFSTALAIKKQQQQQRSWHRASSCSLVKYRVRKRS